MSSTTTTITELLSGILRFFPNSMIVTLLLLGITTGRLCWILVSIGGILTVVLTQSLQYLLGRSLGFGPYPFPGAAVVDACSLLPSSSSASAASASTAIPSVWIATSTFFITYILVNAVSVYTRQPLNVSKDKLSVQQRKGMGLISMIAVLILFGFLLVPRWYTTCENIWGLVLGLAIGIGGGYGWWRMLSAGGSDVFPDIHGVMIGLKPGPLHTSPLACSVKK